ncbi:MAG: hypothetical protein Q8L04_05550 [Ignavibacteria bacterium]|nr:hypothetical protein [Ignavibacteria bacterium]
MKVDSGYWILGVGYWGKILISGCVNLIPSNDLLLIHLKSGLYK